MGSIDIQGVQMEIPDGIRVIQMGIPDGTTRILIEMGEITIIIETQTMDKILVTRIKPKGKIVLIRETKTRRIQGSELDKTSGETPQSNIRK